MASRKRYKVAAHLGDLGGGALPLEGAQQQVQHSPSRRLEASAALFGKWPRDTGPIHELGRPSMGGGGAEGQMAGESRA